MTEAKDKSDMKMEKPFNIEERMGRVEGALGQMGKRLDNVDTAIVDLRNHVDTEMGDLRKEMTANMGDLRKEMTANMGDLRKEMTANMGELRDHVDTKMDRNFQWTIGMIITMWVTIILAILFKIP